MPDVENPPSSEECSRHSSLNQLGLENNMTSLLLKKHPNKKMKQSAFVLNGVAIRHNLGISTRLATSAVSIQNVVFFRKRHSAQIDCLDFRDPCVLRRFGSSSVAKHRFEFSGRHNWHFLASWSAQNLEP